MFFSKSLAIAAAIFVAVSAGPVERQVPTTSLPLKRVSNVKSLKDLVIQGKKRLAYFNGAKEDPKLADSKAVGSGAITNTYEAYTAPVRIGDKTWNLVVDTGTAITWCGSRTRCEKTPTGKSTGNEVFVSYGTGYFSGTQYVDVVSVNGLTVKQQSIGAATKSADFNDADGILGLGPVILSYFQVANTRFVPTFMNNLYRQGSISSEVLGVSYRPQSGSADSETNGLLTIGGVDSSRFSGDITYFPRVTREQHDTAADWWGIGIASISYGTTTLASHTSGIVDTGTSIIFIPDEAYKQFLKINGGSESDGPDSLPTFTTKPTGNMTFTFGSTSFALTPDQYLVPRFKYGVHKLDPNKYYAYFAAAGVLGVDCIIGQKFLEHYYAVFDNTKSRVGFAPAK